ncbi:LCP family protein [Faecalicatena contorta]|uniref:LCP family protein n=1 Tax=Faecalicatena contorta TaxID=39482 RepID=UPI0019603FB5|nr:LCP family protein [Faecalicatena contorta]MBM6685051.1 LCP family protein [Faecalicatena contorta]MBM6710579.1 LCP family protein [Faecalicatena contorta]
MAKERKHYRRGRRKKNRGFASWSLGKKIASIVGGTFLIVAAAGAVLLASKLAKIDTVELDADKLNISKEARERGTGYLNVALFGVDSRDNELGEGTRSDTIMIASLNRETLEVKISSVYRDTLLQQSDGTLNKANAAYAYGGPEGAVAMLNENLDMDIEHYVTVNFNALIDVIDAVGGVEIDVQQEEISYINGYATEIIKVTGKDSMGVMEPGLQTLNGVQATAYSRIRYTAGDDFKRAERQREVLTKVIEKLQGASLSQINKIIDKVFPEVSTNFTLTEILDYALDAFDYKLGETTGFPFDKSTDTLNNIGSVVIPVTLESNVQQLHEFFFGAGDGYTPSSTVSTISGNIVAKAGDRQADTDEDSQAIMEQPDDSYYDYDYESSSGSSSGSGSSGSGGSGWTGGSGGSGWTGDSGDVSGGSGGSGSGGEVSGGSGGSGDGGAETGGSSGGESSSGGEVSGGSDGSGGDAVSGY